METISALLRFVRRRQKEKIEAKIINDEVIISDNRSTVELDFKKDIPQARMNPSNGNNTIL